MSSVSRSKFHFFEGRIKMAACCYGRVMTEAGQRKNKKKRLSKEERLKKRKEKEIRALLLEVLFYVLFLALLVSTVANNKDPQAFGYRHSTLTFVDPHDAVRKIQRIDQFWHWVHFTLLPFLYPTRGWNDSVVARDDRLVATFASYRVGPLRIRQHRVRDEPCSIEAHFTRLGIRCLQSWSNSYMDSRHYRSNWVSVKDQSEWEANGGDWSAWDYRSWSEIGGIPIAGVFGVYPSGGYVSDISGSLQQVKRSLSFMEASDWIDSRTRFISVEFSLFCPAANLFAMVPVVFEFPQANVLMGKASLYPFRLFSYLGGYPAAKMACDVLVYMAVIWFVTREACKMYEERSQYFKEIWNILELINLLLSIAAISLYVGRHVITTYVSKEVSKVEGQFYNFQTLAMWDKLFTILLAFVCFLSTLQLLHLLRFNRRMSMLSVTLREAGKDLSSFFLVFILVFIAFMSFGYIIFGSNLVQYSSAIRSIETLVTVSLGQFDYYALTYVNFVMAPLFLFGYMMFIVFILINMLITILNDAFATVREDSSKQPNDYELVDYILARVAIFLWTLNPVRFIWAQAHDVGIVDAEAPKLTESSKEKLVIGKKKARVRTAGVNYRPRHRHRCTLNADLVRLHNRLDTLNVMADNFSDAIKAEGPGIGLEDGKRVSFKETSREEQNTFSLFLNDSGSSSKEHVVPGILRIRKYPTNGDNLVPEITSMSNVSLTIHGEDETSNSDYLISKSPKNSRTVFGDAHTTMQHTILVEDMGPTRYRNGEDIGVMNELPDLLDLNRGNRMSTMSHDQIRRGSSPLVGVTIDDQESLM